MLGNVACGSRNTKLAAPHDRNAIADADQLGELARHDENRLAGEGEAVDQLIDLGLAADVDAAGWLIEEEDVHVVLEQSGEGNLLLVSTGEVGDRLLGAIAPDAELLDPHGSHLVLPSPDHDAGRAEAP